MLLDVLIWLYVTNTVLFAVHEVDAGYWKEWELFGFIPGLREFLWLHIPVFAVVLVGLVLLAQGSPAGVWFALVGGFFGIGGFGFHMHQLRRGHPQFDAPFSRGLLWAWLLTSIAQQGVVVAVLVQGA